MLWALRGRGRRLFDYKKVRAKAADSVALLERDVIF